MWFLRVLRGIDRGLAGDLPEDVHHALDEATDLLVSRLINFVAPLEDAGAPVTAARDVPVAPGS